MLKLRKLLNQIGRSLFECGSLVIEVTRKNLNEILDNSISKPRTFYLPSLSKLL